MSVALQTIPHNTSSANVLYTVVTETWWCWTLQHTTGCSTCSATYRTILNQTQEGEEQVSSRALLSPSPISSDAHIPSLVDILHPFSPYAPLTPSKSSPNFPSDTMHSCLLRSPVFLQSIIFRNSPHPVTSTHPQSLSLLF